MSEKEKKEVPKPLIWKRIDPQVRGPARTLDYNVITKAAIEIADADGLAAVSMRAIAKRLGAGTMSLYRHVGSRDDLLELMYDGVLGELGLDPPGTPWREALTNLARRIREGTHRHPWLPQIEGYQPKFGPNALRMMETAMSWVDGLGLTIDQMLDRVNVTMSFADGFVRGELAEEEARRRTGLDEQAWRELYGPYLQGLLDTGDYPYMKRIVIEAEDFPENDDLFERRLGMVLDGLEAGLPH